MTKVTEGGKKGTFHKPTKKSGIQAGKLILGGAGSMMLANLVAPNLAAMDKPVVNVSIAAAGGVLAASSDEALVQGLGVGLAITGIFRTMKNVSGSLPVNGIDGAGDVMRRLNPFAGDGLGNPDENNVLVLGNVIDTDLLGPEELELLGEAEVLETITGLDGETIELLGYYDGLGKAKRGWFKKLASKAMNVAKPFAKMALKAGAGFVPGGSTAMMAAEKLKLMGEGEDMLTGNDEIAMMAGL